MKKKKNIIGTLSKRSDDYILRDAPDERRYLENLKKLVAKRKDTIGIEIANEIKRIDTYLKKRYDVIPKPDFAIDWYYRRLRISDKGIEPRIISDNELLECAEQYHEYLDGLNNKQKDGISVDRELNTFVRSKSFTDVKIELLFEQLVKNEYVDKNSDIKTFKRLFSLGDQRPNKIVWKHTTKNKAQTNKKSLLRLFILLQEKNYIILNQPFGINQFNILSDFFTDINGNLMKLNHSNKPDRVSDEISMNGIATINKIVDSLL